MARDMGPVLKRCRYLGIDPIVLGVTKKPSKRKRTMRKLSEYGVQLKEKQKVKFIYGVLEKQFRNYYKVADNMHGITGENLLMLLELRLDNVVYRLGLGRTRKEARQIVRHNLIRVNGKKVNIPSYQVKVGDVIEVKENKKDLQRFKDVLEVTGSRVVPAWLSADVENLKGNVVTMPSREQLDLPVNETLIVELYSK
ncbi:30S ribosomal protein S4 [[Clostridium] colinum]|uniref:30S ribosomal protein S4 n=1 Tax=[Clostridium] colinum TaxID=36835 RepID=UPI0020248AFA|nr:30S ribosomal protein S4 [[Clostridium] colinum]